MQVMVTVIITTVLQTQPGLQASLPACSVTGPGSMQSIYSNFTMKVQSVLWPAHTPQGGRCRGKLFRSKHECWVGLGITSWLDSWSSCFPLCSDRVRYPPHQGVFLAGAECQQHSAGEPWRSSTPVLGTLRALSRVTQRWHSGDTAHTDRADPEHPQLCPAGAAARRSRRSSVCRAGAGDAIWPCLLLPEHLADRFCFTARILWGQPFPKQVPRCSGTDSAPGGICHTRWWPGTATSEPALRDESKPPKWGSLCLFLFVVKEKMCA